MQPMKQKTIKRPFKPLLHQRHRVKSQRRHLQTHSHRQKSQPPDANSAVPASGNTAADSSTESKKKKSVSNEISGILIEDSNLYAQGTSILIKKDTGGKNKAVESNVSIVIQNVQVSSVYGGGYAIASKGNASANVSGSISCTLENVDVSEVYAGGSVALKIINSVSPVAEQWGNLVAAAFKRRRFR